MRTFKLAFLILTSFAAQPLICVGQTQTLTLPQAVSIALEKNPARKMALADTAIAKANLAAAHSGYLPRVDFSETATRGTDSVYAFGTRLRQGRFTQADFAINRLNYPDAIGNFSTRVGATWNVFNSFATTFQTRQARSMRDAADRHLTRTDQEVIYRVIESYYGVLLARRQVDVATQTVKTAQAMVESASAKVEAGTVVQADELSAKANLATRQQDLIRSHSAFSIAQSQLDSALGIRRGLQQELSESLEERSFPLSALEEVEADAMSHRPDLQAIALQMQAQQNGVKAAKAALGPQVNVFGSWQADNPSFASNGSTNWMAGAELRIDLFARDKVARLSSEKAALSKAGAARQMAEDNVRLDVQRAYYEHEAARQMLDVTRTSTVQTAESLRMIRDRYESGLATITDLLRVEDADRAARTDYWQSVYRYSLTFAALQLASGELNAQSPVVIQ